MNKNFRTALIIGGIIVALLIIMPLAFGLTGGWWGNQPGYGMMGPWMMGGFGGMWFMPVLVVIFWGLVVWGIIALVRGASYSGNGRITSHPGSPMEILKARYASGEIKREEFEQKKKDLA